MTEKVYYSVRLCSNGLYYIDEGWQLYIDKDTGDYITHIYEEELDLVVKLLNEKQDIIYAKQDMIDWQKSKINALKKRVDYLEMRIADD